MIVFPSKSTAFKNDRTGGAKVLSQLGEPMKIISASSTLSVPWISGGQYPLSISSLAYFTAVLYENEYGFCGFISLKSPPVIKAMSSANRLVIPEYE